MTEYELKFDKVLIPPVSIGDNIYCKGHGNRKNPEIWEVAFLGYNGKEWFINIVLYDDKKFVKSMQIMDSQLDKDIYFTSRKLYEQHIKEVKK